MIPTTPVLETELTETEVPSRTYKLHAEINRISGWTDEQEAVAQAIYLILNIERYQYLIYSWNYGGVAGAFGKTNAICRSRNRAAD